MISLWKVIKRSYFNIIFESVIEPWQFYLPNFQILRSGVKEWSKNEINKQTNKQTRGREGRVLKTRQLLHFVCPLLIFENPFEVQKIFLYRLYKMYGYTFFTYFNFILYSVSVCRTFLKWTSLAWKIMQTLSTPLTLNKGGFICNIQI